MPIQFPTLKFFKPQIIMWLCAIILVSSCATVPPPSAQDIILSTKSAMTIPYRLGATGTYTIDVSINGSEVLPFTIDSAASISALYETRVKHLSLIPSGETITVHGLMEKGERAVIADTQLGIGNLPLSPAPVAVLPNAPKEEDTAGLIGADILSDFALLFDPESMTITFIPSAEISKSMFYGWRRIALKQHVGNYPDLGLHFASAIYNGRESVILIDTAIDRTLVNWPLAEFEDAMRDIRRDLRSNWEIQGANGNFSPVATGYLPDLSIGRQYWQGVKVTVMNVDSLSSIAPTHKPMIIAGADLFNTRTVVFDFGGDAIYIRPHPDDPEPPQSHWSSLSTINTGLRPL